MEGNIYIYGEIINHKSSDIDAYGMSSLRTVMKQVEQQPNAEIFNVHINSVGGEVNEGFKIYDYLKSLGKTINTYSDGFVASISTIIFMAGENRYIREHDKFMIHNPWGEVKGNAVDLEKYATELRSIETRFIEFYSGLTTIEESELQAMLDQETYLTTEQLISFGFATEIIGDLKAVAKININKQKQEMSEKLTKVEVEGMFDNLFAKIGKLFTAPAKAKIVTDAEGTELDFPEVAEDGTPVVGDKTTAKDGDYLMPNGETFIIVGGNLTEIKPVAEEAVDNTEEIEALKQKIAELEASAQAKSVEYQNSLSEISKEMKTIKASISGNFEINEKEENEEKVVIRTFKTKY